MYPTLWCPKRAICKTPKHESSQKRHQLLSSAFTWKARCKAGRALKQRVPTCLTPLCFLAAASKSLRGFICIWTPEHAEPTAAWLHGNSQDPGSWEIIHASFSMLSWWQQGSLLEMQKRDFLHFNFSFAKKRVSLLPSVAPFTRSHH